MTAEGLRPELRPVRPAPEALVRAIADAKEISTSEDHIKESGYITQKIGALLDALSIPKVYIWRDSQIDFTSQENTWRRMLSFPVEVSLSGEPYFLHATQLLDEAGENKGVVLEATTNAPDEISIASVSFDPQSNYEVVHNARGQLASKAEINRTLALTDLLVSEAPLQAVAKGRISPHWMERYNIKRSVEGGFSYKEGFPLNYLEHGKPRLYEVITYKGARDVCTIVVAGKDYGWAGQTGQLLWLEELHQEVSYGEANVAAWREV